MYTRKLSHGWISLLIIILFTGCYKSHVRSATTYKVTFIGRVDYHDDSSNEKYKRILAHITYNKMGTTTNNDGTFKLTITFPVKGKRSMLAITSNGYFTKTFKLSDFKNRVRKDTSINLGTIILNPSDELLNTLIN